MPFDLKCYFTRWFRYNLYTNARLLLFIKCLHTI